MLNQLEGTVERRILVNYRVAPEVAAELVPAPFIPTVVEGFAVAGICLIELSVRPSWMPDKVRFRSINGAHRIAIQTTDGRDAVYIKRRDSSSLLNVAAGGRLFPGVCKFADAWSREPTGRTTMGFESRDGSTSVNVVGSVSSELRSESIFDTTAEVSDFFERGALAYSDRPDGRFDELVFETQEWSVAPLDVALADSSFFDDESQFPAGSISLDNALLMTDIDHTWHRSHQRT